MFLGVRGTRSLRNGYEVVAFGFVLCDQVIGGGDGLAAIGAHVAVATVVKQDDVAAANLLRDFPLDHRGRRGVPVVASNVPHHGLKSKFAGDAEDCRPSSSERRTKEIGMFAD